MNWLKFLITKLAQQGSINYLLKSNPSLFKEYKEKKKDIIIPEVYFGEAGEILKKWIFYRSKQGESVNLNGLDVILINPNDKAKTWFNKPNFSFQDLIKKNEEYHNQLKETKNRTYAPKYPINILKQYPNGLAWGRLETGFCGEYGKSLGHCGNVNGKNDDTQRIYTFYDTKTNIHYLTFIYHQNGILGEAKAYGNSKPPIDKIRILNREDLSSVDAQEVYKDLLLLKDKDQYIWNVIRGAGYKPENNFQFEDLNEKDREEVKKERENIDDYFSHKKGKDSKKLYFIEKGELYFNKNITKEQLKELILKDDNIFLNHIKTYKYINKFNLLNDKDIFKIILESSQYSYQIAFCLNFDINKIPKEIIESVAKNSTLAYFFAKNINFDLTKIPIIIIKTIANDIYNSYSFARELNFDSNKIPKEIIKTISEDAHNSYSFFAMSYYNLNKVPKEIIEGISKEPGYSIRLVRDLDFDLNKIPKIIIERILNDIGYRKLFLNQLVDRNIEIPDWIKNYKPSVSR